MSSLDATDPLEISLSAREIEIIELVAEGLTNQEIADRLTISKRTASVRYFMGSFLLPEPSHPTFVRPNGPNVSVIRSQKSEIGVNTYSGAVKYTTSLPLQTLCPDILGT